jgi:hypothetical protein
MLDPMAMAMAGFMKSFDNIVHEIDSREIIPV